MRFVYLLLFFISWFQMIQGKDIKTLVLVIASDNQPLYVELEKIWRSYMDIDPTHFECYFLKSNENLDVPVKIENKTIWCRAKEQIPLPGLLDKTLMSINYFKDSLDDYDFVVRTNLSSFWIFDNLLNFLNTSPRTNFYSGIIHGKGSDFCNGKGWVCGAGIIMSSDLAKSLIDNQDYLLNSLNWPNYPIDDLMIAKFFNEQNIQFIPSKYCEITSPRETFKLKQLKNRSDLVHIRVRTTLSNRLEFELPIHKTLLKKYYNKNPGAL